ncbi:MAG: glycoside hydrolase family 10 protein [Drouetiella hepatica Uher 2000/2452]|uniref:Glycoside hydrolase family 10 protein n=1 Tax=Drouetiella hepatica Uher 2000/2452 TaxID=904376 RepID=A0A951QAN5_9CYAN|nr:glycoside hydrolase family 10 protein [Drouetiella hepatica Uher 2000/2452]
MKGRFLSLVGWSGGRSSRLESRLSRFSKTASRSLLLLFLLSFAGVWLIRGLSPAIAQLPRQEIRGVWMTSNDTAILRDRQKMQDAVSQLKRLNFNTIYPVVWNSGYALYPSATAQQAEIQPFVFKGLEGQDILAELIAQGHRQGLLVMPWFEFGFMAPPTSELALNHPGWLTQKRDGSQISISAAGEVMWLNPFHPEVQQFITNLVVEVVTQYSADGIQFDDHMSLPNEFGYDDYTIALYKKETKKDPPANSTDPAWVRWRADKITAFMVKLNQAVKAQKPSAIFSVSPNYYDFAYRLHLQDWLAWIRQNIVDELVIQVYRPNLQSFLEQLALPEVLEAQKKIPTGIGILTGLRNSPVPMRQIQSQVRAAQQQNLGVSFFYYESLWDYAPEAVSDRQAGFQTLFPYPALRSAVQSSIQ